MYPNDNQLLTALTQSPPIISPLKIGVLRRKAEEQSMSLMWFLISEKVLEGDRLEEAVKRSGVSMMPVRDLNLDVLGKYPLENWQTLGVAPLENALVAFNPYDPTVHEFARELGVETLGFADREIILFEVEKAHAKLNAPAPVGLLPEPSQRVVEPHPPTSIPVQPQPQSGRERKVLEALELQVRPGRPEVLLEEALLDAGQPGEGMYKKLASSSGAEFWADLTGIEVMDQPAPLAAQAALLVRRGPKAYYLTKKAFAAEEIARAGGESHPIALTLPQVFNSAFRSGRRTPKVKPNNLQEALVQTGAVSETRMSEMKGWDNGRVERTLLGSGQVNDEQVAQAWGLLTGKPYVNLVDSPPSPEVRHLMSAAYVVDYQAIPLELRTTGELFIGIADPDNIQRNDGLENEIRTHSVRFAVVGKTALKSFIERYYRQQAAINAVGHNLAAEEDISTEETDENALGQLLRSLIREAATNGVSDIHMSTYRLSSEVRMRHDGQLETHSNVPKLTMRRLTRKVMLNAKLDITNPNSPQDGKMRIEEEGMDLSLRVSVLPAEHGSNVVLRLLPKGAEAPLLSQSGISDKALQRLRRIAQKPHGLFLITGPTGSGKTRTGLSLLGEVAVAEESTFSIEDPIEYELPGVVQSEINPEQGRTWASMLRALLRQDPDNIYVGEMRDSETAHIGVEAAFTGHLVIATLHTNSAPATWNRLIGLLQGANLKPIEAAVNASAALIGVLAQRLVRRLCPHCRILDTGGINAQLLGREMPNTYLANPEGCPQCRRKGYRGRIGIFELLEVSEELKAFLTTNPPENEIAAFAQERGLLSTLAEDGIEKVSQGITTAQEVLRFATEE